MNSEDSNGQDWPASKQDQRIIAHRWAACWTDYALWLGILLSIGELFGHELYEDHVGWWIAAIAAYFTLFEWKFGWTPGKWLAGAHSGRDIGRFSRQGRSCDA